MLFPRITISWQYSVHPSKYNTKFLYIIKARFSPQLPQSKISPIFCDSGLPLLVMQPALPKSKCQTTQYTQSSAKTCRGSTDFSYFLPYDAPQNRTKICKNISKNTMYFYIVNFPNTQFCQKNSANFYGYTFYFSWSLPDCLPKEKK